MCPPGVDQTMRSPQQWLLYAPELEQRHSFTEEGDGWGTKFTEIFSEGDKLFDTWAMLARPAHSRLKRTPLKSDGRRGLFDLLSNELIDMILEHVVEDPVDTMALGLTCEGFWYPVSQYIHTSYIKSAAPWANTKIILQGSYSTTLPLSLVESPAVSKATRYNGSRMPSSRKLFWAGWDFEQPKTLKQVEREWRTAAVMHKESSHIPDSRWDELQEQLTTSYLFPCDQNWLLRNFTNKEFVSSGHSTQRNIGRSEKSVEGLRFEDVLLMKIFWASHSHHERSDKECHPSVWAGHCFDVVTEAFHKAEGGDGWRDVTAETERDVVAWKLAQGC
ncbi:hypothetical protein DL95DRAFT_396933 [Leptodontidium sp. 2 PMI_412]|nr:hypothetical protein DL95DRAFT_396933 [Leptodontidium sp. 2 PMI_412]